MQIEGWIRKSRFNDEFTIFNDIGKRLVIFRMNYPLTQEFKKKCLPKAASKEKGQMKTLGTFRVAINLYPLVKGKKWEEDTTQSKVS